MCLKSWCTLLLPVALLFIYLLRVRTLYLHFFEKRGETHLWCHLLPKWRWCLKSLEIKRMLLLLLEQRERTEMGTTEGATGRILYLLGNEILRGVEVPPVSVKVDHTTFSGGRVAHPSPTHHIPLTHLDRPNSFLWDQPMRGEKEAGDHQGYRLRRTFTDNPINRWFNCFFSISQCKFCSVRIICFPIAMHIWLIYILQEFVLLKTKYAFTILLFLGTLPDNLSKLVSFFRMAAKNALLHTLLSSSSTQNTKIQISILVAQLVLEASKSPFFIMRGSWIKNA